MARPILVYGHPAAGKTYALKNLNPDTTIIIDADGKGGLPWFGWKQHYSSEKKNFVTLLTLDKIFSSLKSIVENEKYNHIKTIVIDGLNSALAREQAFYDEWNNTKNGFEKYDALARKALRLIYLAQTARDDSLNIIFTAHVECADSYMPTDVDHMLTPGKQLEKKYKIEGQFNFVFYAKVDDEGNHVFETQPNRSTAKSSEGCFQKIIPNDFQFILDSIDAYERGELING